LGSEGENGPAFPRKRGKKVVVEKGMSLFSTILVTVVGGQVTDENGLSGADACRGGA